MKINNKFENKIKIFTILFLISTVLILSTVSITSAAISCLDCQVGNCNCIVGICSSGIFSVYNNSACSGNPIFEYTFSARNVPWAPDTSATYWVQAYCDDGVTLERCVSQTVASLQQTTTTTKEQSTTTTTEVGGGGGGSTLWLIVAIIIVVGIIGFLIYRLFFSKKGKKTGNYEELYRKWGARTR